MGRRHHRSKVRLVIDLRSRNNQTFEQGTQTTWASRLLVQDMVVVFECMYEAASYSRCETSAAARTPCSGFYDRTTPGGLVCHPTGHIFA